MRRTLSTLVALAAFTFSAQARDLDGQHAADPLKSWFDGLKGETYYVWRYTRPLLPDIGWRWEQAYNQGVKFDNYSKPWLGPNGRLYEGTWTFFGKDRNIWSDEQIGFRKVELVY